MRMLALFIFVPSVTTAGVLFLYPGDHVLHAVLFGILTAAAIVLFLSAPRLGERLGPHL